MIVIRTGTALIHKCSDVCMSLNIRIFGYNHGYVF